jgi:hypothetical protein
MFVWLCEDICISVFVKSAVKNVGVCLYLGVSVCVYVRVGVSVYVCVCAFVEVAAEAECVCVCVCVCEQLGISAQEHICEC